MKKVSDNDRIFSSSSVTYGAGQNTEEKTKILKRRKDEMSTPGFPRKKAI